MSTSQTTSGSPSNLWIVGSGGAALQVWAVLKALGSVQYFHKGFVVVEEPRFDVEGLCIWEEDKFLECADPRNDLVVFGIGSPQAREVLAHKFKQAGFESPTLIHPSAIVGPNVNLGEGCVVMANVILDTHINVGRHVLVNLGALIAHEVAIGSFANIGPNTCLAGNTIVGDRCDLGAGVVCRPRITLGSDIVAGAGAVIVNNYNESTTILGVPAVPIRRLARPSESYIA